MRIYKTTNLITDKIYVGQTKIENENYYGSGKYLKRAIKKYGKKNFKKEILEDGIDDIELLNEREKFWIKKLNSKSPMGYNLNDGGDGCENPSDEIREIMSKKTKERFKDGMPTKTKQKLSVINKIRFQDQNERLKTSVATKEGMTSEIRKHLSEMKKGKPPPNKGKDSRYILICDRCKNSFKSYNKHRKYCSVDCCVIEKGKEKVVLFCKVCMKKVRRNKKVFEKHYNVFCSKKCYGNYMRGKIRREYEHSVL